LATGLLLAACLGLGHTESRTYIACDRPITCCISYGTQTVTLQVQAREACEVSVWAGFEPQWAFLNGEKAREGWRRAPDGMVTVPAGAGEALWEFGVGDWPLRGGGPPFALKADGKQRTLMQTSFWARRMEARGEVKLPLGLYRVTLIPAYPIPNGMPPPKLRIGGQELGEWDEVPAANGRPSLRAKADTLLGGNVGLELTWADTFTRSPMREILLETTATATPLAKTDPPDFEAPGSTVIEAEDYKREGDGGPVQVSRGEHADQHGGASIFSFGPGKGHWVEWQFSVPTAGKYVLHARTATQEEYSLRSLTIDRKPPFPGAALLQFPGTGGWARTDASQWVWTVLAGADGRPLLELAAGEHRLRLTTIGDKHVNVDVMALVPR
jgi:hypothetical protein